MFNFVKYNTLEQVNSTQTVSGKDGWSDIRRSERKDRERKE